MKTNYFDCEKELLGLYLDKEIFVPQRSFQSLLNEVDNKPEEEYMTNLSGIELIVRPECNQKCEYCYIARYGKDLYPLEERISNEQILINIDKLLTYIYTTRSTYINHWELFAGDLMYDGIFFDILDIYYKHFENLYRIYAPVFQNNKGLILMPSNFAWIEDEEKAARMEEYIAKFEKLNWEIGLSISTDGKYAVDTRENRPLDDAHFDKLFQWTNKHPKMGFHPIISASNVRNAIKNYDWWKEMYKKYYHSDSAQALYTHDFLPYWLEARNDEWHEDDIQEYLKLLEHMLEDRFDMHDRDPHKMAYHMFCGDGDNNTLPKLAQNDLIRILVNNEPRELESIGCTISNLLCITVNNFAIVPCHRLNYHILRGGYFIQDELGAIADIKPFNVSGLITTKMAPSQSVPGCAQCLYNRVCHKGCLGAQYEATGEVFMPCLTVCDLFKESFDFLMLWYDRHGVYRSALEQGLIPPEDVDVYETILREANRKERERIYGND